MDILIVAHFITEFTKDGTSRFIYIAEQLSKYNDVEIVTSRFDHISKKQRVEKEYNLETKITLLTEPTYQKNICLQRFISHNYFGRQVKEYLKSRKKPDVIYCAVPSLDCAYYAAKYAQKNNIKFIVDVQDLWPEAFKLIVNMPILSDVIFSPMKYRADYIYSCADIIVGVSRTYCNRAKLVNEKNAECIPVFLGTKLNCFDKYAEENRANRIDNKFILGYCGTLGHSYDIKCIIDAIALLKNKGLENISFWIIGDGPLKNEFEKYSRNKSIDACFYGRLPYPQMCGLLASCDICVNPISKRAAQSIINKHGDYAASGLPVINTQTNKEYRDLINKYKCGINCKCSDPIQVADAIEFLLNNKKEREHMGKCSRQMAEDLFNRTNSYRKIYMLFKNKE